MNLFGVSFICFCIPDTSYKSKHTTWNFKSFCFLLFSRLLPSSAFQDSGLANWEQGLGEVTVGFHQAHCTALGSRRELCCIPALCLKGFVVMASVLNILGFGTFIWKGR